jgi:MOSC domain-containing protein YiiM
MTGSVVQVSVSRGGVPKRKVEQAEFTPQGVAGDSYSHPSIHGGLQQAVLIISAEGTRELAAQGFALYPGALGENLTTAGIDRKQWRAGQRWRVGPDVILELTKLREPCKSIGVYGPGIQAAVFDTLANHGDPSSPKWGLGGFYAAVVQAGIVRAGDEVRLLRAAAFRVAS